MDFQQLLPAIAGMSWKNMVMIAIGLTLIFLAIRKQYEPTLLLPIGFGTILVNIPFSAVLTQGEVLGPLNVFFDAGIITEVFPLLIFVVSKKCTKWGSPIPTSLTTTSSSIL